MFKYIADSNTGDYGAGHNDITNFLRSLIIPALLEQHRFKNCQETYAFRYPNN